MKRQLSYLLLTAIFFNASGLSAKSIIVNDDAFPIDPLPTVKVDHPRIAYEKIEAENTNNYSTSAVTYDLQGRKLNFYPQFYLPLGK